MDLRICILGSGQFYIFFPRWDVTTTIRQFSATDRFSVVPLAHSLAMTALLRDAMGPYNVNILYSAHYYTVFASFMLVIVANPGIFEKKLNRGNGTVKPLHK